MPLSGLIEALHDRTRCHLTVTAISKNVVDAVIEMANEKGISLSLALDARGSEAFSPCDLAALVRKRDTGDLVALARIGCNPDRYRHDGSDAVSAAKVAISRDIDAGFDIIHVDASIENGAPTEARREVELQTSLVNHAWAEAQCMGREVAYSVGGAQTGPQDDEAFRCQ